MQLLKLSLVVNWKGKPTGRITLDGATYKIFKKSGGNSDCEDSGRQLAVTI